jgi:iron complex transport system substrate-binding protein
LTSDADVILFGSGEGKTGAKLGAKNVTLEWGEDFAVIQTNAEAINQAISLPSDISDDWAKRIEVLSQRATQRTTKPNILYLSRSGGSAGKGTLVDAAITSAGGVNIAQTSGWFTPDPEEIISYEPDLIITSYFKNGYESVQSTALKNKVVQRFIAQHPSVHIEGNLWPCAGPGLIEAAELIADAIDKLP